MHKKVADQNIYKTCRYKTGIITSGPTKQVLVQAGIASGYTNRVVSLLLVLIPGTGQYTYGTDIIQYHVDTISSYSNWRNILRPQQLSKFKRRAEPWESKASTNLSKLAGSSFSLTRLCLLRGLRSAVCVYLSCK